MKILINNFTFDPSLKKITFPDYSLVNLGGFLIITNTTDNVVIYDFGDPLLGGSVTGNVLTLNFDTSSMSSTDSLQIFYDDGSIPANNSSILSIDSTIGWLKTLVRLLKPLSIVTGGGSNRLSVDVNAVASVTTVTTVTTVASVTAVQNQVNMGGVSAFTMQQAMLRNAFANGIRNNISHS